MSYDSKNGFLLEKKFYEAFYQCCCDWEHARLLILQEEPRIPWVITDIQLKQMNWISQENKSSEFDFEIKTMGDKWLFIDVVGCYTFEKYGWRLNTSHKFWGGKLAHLRYSAKNHDFSNNGYLAFSPGNVGSVWFFLKIHNKLPSGDVLITESTEACATRCIRSVYGWLHRYK